MQFVTTRVENNAQDRPISAALFPQMTFARGPAIPCPRVMFRCRKLLREIARGETVRADGKYPGFNIDLHATELACPRKPGNERFTKTLMLRVCPRVASWRDGVPSLIAKFFADSYVSLGASAPEVGAHFRFDENYECDDKRDIIYSCKWKYLHAHMKPVILLNYTSVGYFHLCHSVLKCLSGARRVNILKEVLLYLSHSDIGILCACRVISNLYKHFFFYSLILPKFMITIYPTLLSFVQPFFPVLLRISTFHNIRMIYLINETI